MAFQKVSADEQESVGILQRWSFRSCDHFAHLDHPHPQRRRSESCTFASQNVANVTHLRCELCYGRNLLGCPSQRASFLKAADRNLLYLNIFLLLMVSIIPFPTALIGQYSQTHAAVILYAANLMLVNTAGTLLWLYATSQPALATAAVTPTLRKKIAVLHMSPVAIYATAAALSFVDFRISFLLLVAVPIFFIIPVPFISRMLAESSSK